MSKYYFLREEGACSFGVIDKANPAPKGAKIVETEKELQKIEKSAEAECEEWNIKFFNE